MSDAHYVFNRMDSLTKAQIEHIAQTGAMKLYIQALISDCDLKLGRLDCADDIKLLADYKRIVTTRSVYADLLAFFSKITTDKGKQQ